MRHIPAELTSFQKTAVSKSRGLPKSRPLYVDTFRELVQETAGLAYLNKDHMLFFRGQAEDYTNKAGASTLYPGIYRGERVPKMQLELSWDILTTAAGRLCDSLKKAGINGHQDVRRRPFIQWSILQHYEVCPTPLLDLTQSLRVACSFAFLSKRARPVVMAVGLPYVTNRISINSEHDVVNVRLLGICPPDALRPLFQEGFLAGTDGITTDFDSKSELDFNNRLLGKYRLGDRKQFWQGGFKPVSKAVLYPNDDPIQEICEDLKGDLATGVAPGRLGDFLQRWVRVESRIMSSVRRISVESRPRVSMMGAVETLLSEGLIESPVADELHRIRRLRNEIVHRPERVSTEEVLKGIEDLAEVSDHLRHRDL